MLKPVLLLCLVALSAAARLRAPARSSRFGFTLGDQFREENDDGAGVVTGQYGVRTGDGCLRVTRYRATPSGGFRVVSVSKTQCDPKRMVARAKPAPTKKVAPRTTPAPLINRVVTTTQSPRLPKTLFSGNKQEAPPRKKTPASSRNKRPATPRSAVGTGQANARPTTPPPRRTTRKKAAKKKPKISAKQIVQRLNVAELAPNNEARPLDRPEDPAYTFGFTAPGHGHTQTGRSDGSKAGEYYFDSPDGWRRIVSYEANENGFFPVMRRERVPGWTPPQRRTPGGRGSGAGGRDGDDGDGGAGAGGNNGSGENGGNGGNGGNNGSGGNGGGGKGNGADGGSDDDTAKQLLESLASQGTGSCPYYFFYNTKVNFHWERCFSNGTKVGQYGLLHEDGFSYRTSYLADTSGYHPEVSKTPLSPDQQEIVHQFTEGVFILPKTDEERSETEKRILDWLAANVDLLKDPLA